MSNLGSHAVYAHIIHSQIYFNKKRTIKSGPWLNMRSKVHSAFHPSGVGKWVPAAAGKAKTGMAHSDCGWTCGCAGKTVKSLENTCHTCALLRWWFTTKRRHIKCMHLYMHLYHSESAWWALSELELELESGYLATLYSCDDCQRRVPISCVRRQASDPWLTLTTLSVSQATDRFYRNCTAWRAVFYMLRRKKKICCFRKPDRP